MAKSRLASMLQKLYEELLVARNQRQCPLPFGALLESVVRYSNVLKIYPGEILEEVLYKGKVRYGFACFWTGKVYKS